MGFQRKGIERCDTRVRSNKNIHKKHTHTIAWTRLFRLSIAESVVRTENKTGNKKQDWGRGEKGTRRASNEEEMDKNCRTRAQVREIKRTLLPSLCMCVFDGNEEGEIHTHTSTHRTEWVTQQMEVAAAASLRTRPPLAGVPGCTTAAAAFKAMHRDEFDFPPLLRPSLPSRPYPGSS